MKKATTRPIKTNNDLNKLLTEIQNWSTEDFERERIQASKSTWGGIILSSVHRFTTDKNRGYQMSFDEDPNDTSEKHFYDMGYTNAILEALKRGFLTKDQAKEMLEACWTNKVQL